MPCRDYCVCALILRYWIHAAGLLSSRLRVVFSVLGGLVRPGWIAGKARCRPRSRSRAWPWSSFGGFRSDLQRPSSRSPNQRLPPPSSSLQDGSLGARGATTMGH